MSEPVIYTKNFINEETTLVSTHGSTDIARVYDGDKDSQYETTGADDDTTEVTIEAQFKEAGVAIERTIDRVIVVNHNLADIEIEYWNGSAWVSAVAVTSITAGTTILTFTKVSTEKIRIIALETQVADEEKQIGLLLVCAVLLDVGTDATQLNTNYRQKQSQLIMGDGKLNRTVVMHSPYRSAKYGATYGFRLLSDAQYESLRAIKESGDAFLWQPELETKPEDIFLVHWVGALRWAYTSRYKGAGKNMSIEVREA